MKLDLTAKEICDYFNDTEFTKKEYQKDGDNIDLYISVSTPKNILANSKNGVWIRVEAIVFMVKQLLKDFFPEAEIDEPIFVTAPEEGDETISRVHLMTIRNVKNDEVIDKILKNFTEKK